MDKKAQFFLPSIHTAQNYVHLVNISVLQKETPKLIRYIKHIYREKDTYTLQVMRASSPTAAGT